MTSAVEATLPDSAATGTSDAEKLAQIVIRCMACEARFTGADVPAKCPDCGGLLDVVMPTRRKLTPSDLGLDIPTTAQHSGVWRYQPLLPSLIFKAVTTKPGDALPHRPG